MALFDPIRMGASGSTEGYQIERSIIMDGRRDQTNFRFTPSSQGDRRKFTISWWMKCGELANTDQNNNYLFSARRGSNNPQFDIGFSGSHMSFAGVTGGTQEWFLKTQRQFRDPTNWIHFVVIHDTQNSTASERIRLFVNGERITNFDNTSYPSQGFQTAWNTNEAEMNIGRTFYGSGNHNFDGYLAEIHNISGHALDPDNFAETDSETGQWVPIEYTGTDGDTSCRWYLNFADNSNNTASTIGKDSSGQGNNWTPYNINSYNSVLDSPTNNWCTMNPVDKDRASNITVRHGNLLVHTNHGFRNCKSTFGVDSGKWYWEARVVSGAHSFIGINGYDTKTTADRGGETAQDAMIRQNTGNLRTNGGDSSYGSSYSNGDILGFALDMDNGKFYVAKNNTWFNSGNPVNGTNAGKTGLTRRTLAACAPYDNKSFHYNFGQDDTFRGAESSAGNSDSNGRGVFKYAPPSGFLAMCSKNLPDPTVPKGDEYFEAKAYSGNGSQRAIGGLNFSPDLVWVKRRNGSNYHILSNTITGAGNYLVSNTNDAESSGGSNLINGFNSDGFDVGTEQAVNNSSGTYVGWCWDAGSSTVSDSSGSITVNRRTNAKAGFSIISYTGNNTAGATIAHGLGAPPAWIILKSRAGDNWRVYFHSLSNYTNPSHKRLILDGTNGEENANFLNDTAPTSSVISLGGSDTAYNNSSNNYIVFAWSQIPGYSDFGRYVGTGNNFGQYINVGFQPRFILVKRLNSSENWCIWDTARTDIEGEHNYNGRLLRPDHQTDEGGRVSAHAIDITSNGFKIRMTDGKAGDNNSVYAYAAFAKNPFKTSNSR